MSARDPLGSVAWLERTGGRMSIGDRFRLFAAVPGALLEGWRLRRRARRSPSRAAPLFEPPDTAMVRAARAELDAHSVVPMRNHCIRTGYWTQLVLHQTLPEVTPEDEETAWVAALLHDLGLERPPSRGDFSSGGIEILESLAHTHRWPDAQVHAASEAIATNLNLRVDASRSGPIAWAMNVGGVGEIGFGLHRAQMARARIAELESRFPRTDFKPTALQLARAESRRLPGSRFGIFRHLFPLFLRP
jgi:hypothetical protein